MSRETAAEGGEQTRQGPEHEPEQEGRHPVDGRLRVSLRRLVDAQGRMKAADELGVNYKTLARGLDEPGPLTARLRAALLERVLEDGVPALATEGQEPGDPGQDEAGQEPARPSGDAGEPAGATRDATEALRALTSAVDALRGEHGERLTALETRLAAVEAPSPPEAVPVAGAPSTDTHGPAASAGEQPAPVHVVTQEAGPGDQRAYGAAWPLVTEWRAVHTRHHPEGRGVDWLRDEERLRELEIALIGEHELALPPERYRWDGFTRRAQLRWRERTLRRVRGERRRAQWRRWLRRLLTLGLWWR